MRSVSFTLPEVTIHQLRLIAIADLRKNGRLNMSAVIRRLAREECVKRHLKDEREFRMYLDSMKPRRKNS